MLNETTGAVVAGKRFNPLHSVLRSEIILAVVNGAFLSHAHKINVVHNTSELKG